MKNPASTADTDHLDKREVERRAELPRAPRTELGRLAMAARREYIADGGRLLDADELEQELAALRGGVQILDAK